MEGVVVVLLGAADILQELGFLVGAPVLARLGPHHWLSGGCGSHLAVGHLAHYDKIINNALSLQLDFYTFNLSVSLGHASWAL